jgi:hypothetical protein
MIARRHGAALENERWEAIRRQRDAANAAHAEAERRDLRFDGLTKVADELHEEVGYLEALLAKVKVCLHMGVENWGSDASHRLVTKAWALLDRSLP